VNIVSLKLIGTSLLLNGKKGATRSGSVIKPL
jgi:hypothetical protein